MPESKTLVVLFAVCINNCCVALIDILLAVEALPFIVPLIFPLISPVMVTPEAVVLNLSVP